jgi:GH15 family glucan-1,4-alpha-glucosidase
MMPLVGFLPATDPRVLGTVEAIQKHLMSDGLWPATRRRRSWTVSRRAKARFFRARSGSRRHGPAEHRKES